MSALNTTLHSLKPAKFASFQQTLHCMHINAVPAALQHCIQRISRSTELEDRWSVLFVHPKPRHSGIVWRLLYCYTAHPLSAPRHAAAAAIQHNIKQSLGRRQPGIETGYWAGPGIFQFSLQKYLILVLLIFPPPPRTGHHHTTDHSYQVSMTMYREPL